MKATIHMASAISRDVDHVIPLCANFPRGVEPGAGWTHRSREVTCPKCRERLPRANLTHAYSLRPIA